MSRERTKNLLPLSLAFGAAASLLSCAGQPEVKALEKSKQIEFLQAFALIINYS